jgi:hypothetical protein
MEPGNSELLECIDKGLQSYGSSFGRVVYWRLQNTSNLSRDEIPSRLEEFVTEIRKMFGSGVKSIERTIIRELQMRVGHPLQIEKDDDLLCALIEAKKYFKQESAIVC